MSALGESLERMSFVQLLLLFAFVTGYVLALGGLLGPRARRRAALCALATGAGFAALTDPWVHGALLVAFVVAALGLFVLLSWLLARLFGPRDALPEADAATEAASAQAPAQAPRLAAGRLSLPKLARRARTSRG